ncbi:MAG: amidohydrolase family protein [Phascolarctobacterium sp.]|nr:amidohydrolase family protein [Phascolarctobacterium sp.]
MYNGPIIDAHFHYFNIDGFVNVAANAGYVNTNACWQEICKQNNIIMSIAMGNTHDATIRYGGIAPRLINLARPFDEENFNQDANVCYCLGVDSELITPDKIEATAQEFEFYLKQDPIKSHCVGIKLYPGYNSVYVNDKRHWPLFELAKAYDVPVVIHTGDTSWPHAHLKYSHPLTVDDAAADFPDVQFVIAHCGCPWFQDACEVAAKNANVAIDLSGLVAGKPKPVHLFLRNAGFFDNLRTWLNYMGDYSRVMYGSDWPLVNIPLYIQTMAHVVPAEYHEQFFYKNALRIFKKMNGVLESVGASMVDVKDK